MGHNYKLVTLLITPLVTAHEPPSSKLTKWVLLNGAQPGTQRSLKRGPSQALGFCGSLRLLGLGVLVLGEVPRQ